jgi:hypothetical protein
VVLLALGVGALVALPQVPDPAVDRAILTASASKLNEGGAPEHLADLVRIASHPSNDDPYGYSILVGRVLTVTKQSAYVRIDSPDAGTAGLPCCRVRPFDVSDADWRSLRVTIAVEETLTGAHPPTAELSWAVYGNGSKLEDVDAIARALPALGRIVVFTQDNPVGPAWLDIRHSVVHAQRGILQVLDDGSLRLPFAAGREGPRAPCCPVDEVAFLAGIDTLADLRAEIGT